MSLTNIFSKIVDINCFYKLKQIVFIIVSPTKIFEFIMDKFDKRLQNSIREVI